MNIFPRGVSVLTFVLAMFCCGNAQNFQGAYVGGYAGGNQGNADAHTFTVFSPTGYFATSSVPAIAAVGDQKVSPSGFSGGGTAGVNLQHKWLVFGGEADFGFMSMSASTTGTAPYPCCPTTNFAVTQTVSTDWLFTGRGRLGFATGKILIYGTGGLAATKLNYQALFTDTFATAQENGGVDHTRKGWVGGAGAEYRVGPRWSVKGEFLQTDFGQAQTTSTNLTAFSLPIAFPTNTFTHNASLTAHLFRGGLNYHF